MRPGYLSFAPLYRLSRCETMGDFADRVGVKRRNVQRYMHGASLNVAERAAHRLGYLPSEVWGDEYMVAVAEAAMWDDVRRAFRQERARVMRLGFLACERARVCRLEDRRWVQLKNQKYRLEGW